jgi:hypothetical protein
MAAQDGTERESDVYILLLKVNDLFLQTLNAEGQVLSFG